MTFKNPYKMQNTLNNAMLFFLISKQKDIQITLMLMLNLEILRIRINFRKVFVNIVLWLRSSMWRYKNDTEYRKESKN